MRRNRQFLFVGITFILTASVSAPAFAQYHEYSSGLPQVEVDLSVLDDANVEKQIQKNFDPSTHTTVPPVAPVVASPLPQADPYDKFKRPPYTTLQDAYGNQPAIAAPVAPVDPVDALAPIGAPQPPTTPPVAPPPVTAQDDKAPQAQPAVEPAGASAWMSARPEPRKRLLKPAPTPSAASAAPTPDTLTPDFPAAPQDKAQDVTAPPVASTLPETVSPAVAAPVTRPIISNPVISRPLVSRPGITKPVVMSQPEMPAPPQPERPIAPAPVVAPAAKPAMVTPPKDKKQQEPAAATRKQPEPEYAPVITEDAQVPDTDKTADTPAMANIPPMDVTDEIVTPQDKKPEDTAVQKKSSPTETADVKSAPVVPTLADLTVSFQGNTSDLDTDGMTKLDNIVTQLKAADSRLQVRAYATGEDGSKSSARRISLSRALSVRSYLMDKGIKPNRVDVRALGTDTDKSPLDRVDLVFAK